MSNYIPTNSNYSDSATMYQYSVTGGSPRGVLTYGTNIYAIYVNGSSQNCIDLIDSSNVTTNILTGASNNYALYGYGISDDGSIICINTQSGGWVTDNRNNSF